MKKISRYFYKKSTLTFTLIVSLLMVLFLWLLFFPAVNSFAFDHVTPLGLSFGLNEEIIGGFYDCKSDGMIQAHIHFNTYTDIIYALLYGFVFMVWISLTTVPSLIKQGY